MSDSSGRRYGGLTAQERTARRRAAILAAALDRFGTEGYRAGSVKQVCRTAKLTERYFYESFADREDCLGALYDELIAELRDATAAAVEGSLAGDGRVEDNTAESGASTPADTAAAAGIEAFVRNLTGDPRRARVVLIEVVGVSEAMERRRHRVLREFADLTMSVWTHGATAPPEGTRLAATALVGGVNHLLVDWLMEGRRIDPAVLSRACTGLFQAARRSMDGSG
ncbi:TetR/AcrR family transcriptional regulator [Tomitella cavernea]|uniref:TetR/AcrR family transcriptional regulator n=1 Tax=Tomitella cavernea TaxID=1387982 RepID=A0ABP9D2F0_9ACTN|nr:TetR/AcrR family transcriptional regulator [Tomitella cavernea]